MPLVGLEPGSSDVQPVVMAVIVVWKGKFRRGHTARHTYRVALDREDTH